MTCYVTDRRRISAPARRDRRGVARDHGRELSGDGAGRGRGPGRARRQGRDRDDGGGARNDATTLRPRPPAAAGTAAGIPLRPARAAISRAAERGRGAA